MAKRQTASEADISKHGVMVLLIAVIMLSVLGTFTVLTEMPQQAQFPQTSGQINLNVVEGAISPIQHPLAGGAISLNIIK